MKSKRREQVARLAAQGLSNKLIAKELSISPETVKTHMRAIRLETGKARTALWTLFSADAATIQDAMRYRYLRDNGDGFDISVRDFDDDGDEVWVGGYPPADLDAALDKAMAKDPAYRTIATALGPAKVLSEGSEPMMLDKICEGDNGETVCFDTDGNVYTGSNGFEWTMVTK